MPGLSSNPHPHYALHMEGMPMDIEKSRFNMIEQQIRPWDVLDTDVLDLLAAEVAVAPDLREMDARIFRRGRMCAGTAPA